MRSSINASISWVISSVDSVFVVISVDFAFSVGFVSSLMIFVFGTTTSGCMISCTIAGASCIISFWGSGIGSCFIHAVKLNSSTMRRIFIINYFDGVSIVHFIYFQKILQDLGFTYNRYRFVVYSFCALVAQLEEYRSSKPMVASSNLAGCTIFIFDKKVTEKANRKHSGIFIIQGNLDFLLFWENLYNASMDIKRLHNYAEWYYTKYFPSCRTLRDKLMRKCDDEQVVERVMTDLSTLFVEDRIIESRVHVYMGQGKTTRVIRQKLLEKKYDPVMVDAALVLQADILMDP